MNSKILLLIDTTGSMENYIRSLKPSILQLSHLIKLLGTNTKIAILGYKDQTDKLAIESTIRSDFANFDEKKIIDPELHQWLDYCLHK